VSGLDERFRPSMTSISTSVFFFTITNMYCHINSLSIKHVDALESRSVWVSIVTSLLHFIMIGTNKHDVKLKIGWNHYHYMMHQGIASRSLSKLGMFIFRFL
jgi:hypothetical protein